MMRSERAAVAMTNAAQNLSSVTALWRAGFLSRAAVDEAQQTWKDAFEDYTNPFNTNKYA